MDDDTKIWLSTAKFWILLILSIPSAVSATLIFIYFYRERKQISLHLHLTLLLIVVSFLQITTDMPFAITYYHYGIVSPTSDIFCLWWNWWDYSTSGLILVIMAWGSIERHLLVFHDTLMATKTKRIIFHILPMLTVCIYPLVFYFAVIILNSCENIWDYEMLLCIQPCYLIDQPTLATCDFIGNIVVPVVIITVANTFLIVRVVRQKRARAARWSRQRKLTIQLFYIALLYIIFWIPLTVNGLFLTFTTSPIAADLQANYFFFLYYMVPILMPFISITFLSQFKKKVFLKRAARVAPEAIVLNTVFTQRNKQMAVLPQIG